MTDKIQQARRAAFEAWAKNGCGRLSRQNSPDCDPDGYQDSHTDLCWHAFNAALDCVVIELPAERAKRPGFMHETLEGSAHNNCRDLCIDAIESTNLGIKVK